jgi:hypothetical protein
VTSGKLNSIHQTTQKKDKDEDFIGKSKEYHSIAG